MKTEETDTESFQHQEETACHDLVVSWHINNRRLVNPDGYDDITQILKTDRLSERDWQDVTGDISDILGDVVLSALNIEPPYPCVYFVYTPDDLEVHACPRHADGIDIDRALRTLNRWADRWDVSPIEEAWNRIKWLVHEKLQDVST